MSQERTEKLSPKLLSSELISECLVSKYKMNLKKPLRKMEGGVESVAWLAITDQGKWVVKVFALYEGPFEHIEEEVSLYEYLNKHGICVPEVMPSSRGQLVEELKTDLAIYPVTLMKFENLRQCSSSSIKKAELVKIAKTTAQMHKILKQYPRLKKYRQKRFFLNEKARAQAISAYQTLVKFPNATIFSKEELEYIKILDSQMIDYVNNWSGPPALNYSILHGDLALEHAQFLPNGEVYFFDFADRSWAPIALELAIMLVHLYRAENISFERWEELKSWLVSGYTSITELTDQDCAAIKPLMARRLLDEIRWLSEKAIELQHGVDTMGVKRRYKLADYLLPHLDVRRPGGG